GGRPRPGRVRPAGGRRGPPRPAAAGRDARGGQVVERLRAARGQVVEAAAPLPEPAAHHARVAEQVAPAAFSPDNRHAGDVTGGRRARRARPRRSRGPGHRSRARPCGPTRRSRPVRLARAPAGGHHGRVPRADRRTPRRHDHDAGGDADLLAAKAALRDAVWTALSEAGVARFPGARNRIPNFTGAEAAAERLRGTPEWARARTVKANPDSPQLPVRQRALEDGKTVFMAVPRLAEPDPFFLLDPDDLADPPRRAASIAGASRSARRAAVEDLDPVDLVVVGCVAVGADGARLGEGGGFADLERALATAAGLVGPGTVVVTTVHELQVRPAGEI